MNFSLFPRTVYKTKSKISGEIKVKEWLGDRTLSIQGMIQSGGMVKGIWEKALAGVKYQVSGVRNALVLGLGGGTVVRLIKALWPRAKIIGVEIDPEIVEIGKKYFGLSGVKNLEIINADALTLIPSRISVLKHCSKFDLILVDLYLGKKFPKKAESDEFLKKVKKLLSKKGMAIFNRLRTDKPEGFKKKLEKHFSSVELVRTSTNLFFLARSREAIKV